MKLRLLFLLTALLLSCLGWAGCNRGKMGENAKAPLRIAAAANLRNALEDLAALYQLAHTDQEVQITTASSGQLFNQIQNGAPYDLFLSADTVFPFQLHQEGFSRRPPRIYAQGRLILWSMKHLEIAEGPQALTQPLFEKIAIANPATAPYGQAAKEVLQKAGLWEQLQHKIVFGESIAQTNHFIFSEAVDAGITSLSATKGGESKDKGIFIFINQNLHSPINQSMILLKQEKGNPEAAEQFWEFMYSDTAQSILSLHGYSTDF